MHAMTILQQSYCLFGRNLEIFYSHVEVILLNFSNLTSNCNKMQQLIAWEMSAFRYAQYKNLKLILNAWILQA